MDRGGVGGRAGCGGRGGGWVALLFSSLLALPVASLATFWWDVEHPNHDYWNPTIPATVGVQIVQPGAGQGGRKRREIKKMMRKDTE